MSTLKNKESKQVLQKFKEFKALVENQIGSQEVVAYTLHTSGEWGGREKEHGNSWCNEIYVACLGFVFSSLARGM